MSKPPAPRFVVPVPRESFAPETTDPAIQVSAFLQPPSDESLPEVWPPVRKRTADEGGVKASQVAGAMAWSFYTVAMVCFHLARPEAETMFSRFQGTAVRGRWDQDLVPWMIVAIILDVLSASAGIAWVAARENRLSYSLLFQIIIALVSAVAVLVLG